MTGYLGLQSKFQLRNLAMSPIVLPYAVEQKACAFTQTEISSTLAQLAGPANAGDVDSDDEQSEAASHLSPFTDFFSLATLIEEYIAPNAGADNDRKKIPPEKRVELLARILLTVDEGMMWLAAPKSYKADYSERTSNIWQETNDKVRVTEKMSYFHMPKIDCDRLVQPEFGPLDFDGKKEHNIEKWLRILYLLRYASGKITKSKWTMAGRMGATLGSSETERSKLSSKGARQLIDAQAKKWLGHDQDWDNFPSTDPATLPIWMQTRTVPYAATPTMIPVSCSTR